MITRLPRRLGVLIAASTLLGGTILIGPASAVDLTATGVTAVATTDPGDEPPPPTDDKPSPVPDSYIVTLPEDTAPEVTERLALEISEEYGVRLGHVYTASMQGFSFEGPAEIAERISADARVGRVDQDVYFTLTGLGVQINPPSWGIDRIDERSLPLDQKYHFPNLGNSVVAYVIDTGIRLTHQEIAGRAFCGFDPWGSGCSPCTLGHGTHVAGTIGGKSTGVAKGVKIVSVRVFGCSGWTTASIVIAGVNYVTFSQMINPGQRSVANMSLGGGSYPPLNAAVANSINHNVHYSVSAGNSGGNSCFLSPAQVPTATTVAATASNDARPAWSSYGPCVDLFAPGVSIRSAWHTSDSAYVYLSGTSMAAPHVTGTAAMWRHKFPGDNAHQVAAALNANATPNVVINPGAGSPNRLLFMGMIPV